MACQRFLMLLALAYSGMLQSAGAKQTSVMAADWNYGQHGANWKSLCKTGLRQSPIRLSDTQAISLEVPRVKFGNYNKCFNTTLYLTNTGHTVEIELPATEKGEHAFISGGLLPNKYEAMGVHFHWGSAYTKGSEHLVNNRRYDVEMHIVHKNIKYATLSDAGSAQDGLAVLAVFFKSIYYLPDRLYPGLNKIFNRLRNVTNYGDSARIGDRLTLGMLLGDLNTRDFFTYHGSTTTPNCYEAVTWIVFPQPLPIAISQISKFWKIRDERYKFIRNNFRKLQKRNLRPVYLRRSAILL